MSTISKENIRVFITELAMLGLPSRFASVISGFALDPWQEKALDYQGKRLLMNCSRQAGKSFVATCLALHTAVYKPNSLTLIVSFTLDQAKELIKRIVDLSQWSDMVPFPEQNKKSLTLDNGSRIISISSTEGSVRGYTADLIIVDEASRCEDLVYAAIRPTLSVSGGKLVLLSSPHGQRGFFWREYSEPSEPWVPVEIPATDCPRITKTFLKSERIALGERIYEQEYFCRFLEPEDAMMSADLVKKSVSPEVEEFPFYGKDNKAKIESRIQPFTFREL